MTTEPVTQSSHKRDRLVALFAEQMRRELDVPINTEKGDDWELASTWEHEHEIVYHLVKLLLAIGDGDLAGIREYTADTANHLAMLADTFGVLDEPDYTPSEYRGHEQRVAADRMLDVLKEMRAT